MSSHIVELVHKMRLLFKDAVFCSLAKNGGWAVAGEVVASVALLAETFILARILSLDTFGTFLVILSVPEVVFGLLDFRSRDAVVKFLPELRASGRDDAVAAFLRWVFTVDLGVSVLGLAILVGGLLFFRDFFPTVFKHAHLVLLVSLGSALAHCTRSVGAFLRVSGMFPLSVKLGMCASGSRLLLVGVAAAMQGDLVALCTASAAYGLVFFSFMTSAAALAFRKSKIQLWRSKSNWGEWKTAGGFMVSTNVSSTLKMVSKKLDVIVVAALASPEVVALYKVASRIALAIMLFSDPLILAVYPELSKLHAERQFRKMRHVVGVFLKTTSCVACVFLIVFFVWGGPILQALAGEKYVAAYPAARIMVFGTTFSMVFFWARPLVLVYGMTTRLVPVSVLAVLAQFASLFILTPTMGAAGAGVGLMAYNLVTTVLLTYSLRLELFPRANGKYA